MHVVPAAQKVCLLATGHSWLIVNVLVNGLMAWCSMHGWHMGRPSSCGAAYMGHPGLIHGMHVLHMLRLRLARLATRGSSHQLVHGMRHAPAAGCRRLQEWRTAGVQWTTPGQAASHGISCMPGSDLLM